MDNFENSQECVLITGASSGIGRQCAIQLSEKYRLVLCARTESEIHKTLSLCRNSKYHLAFINDLSNTRDLENSLKTFLEATKIKINKFLHCAGIFSLSPIKMVTYDSFLETLNVNLISAALIVKTLVSKRINNNALNNIVFISSIISNRGSSAFGIYGASKSGIDGLMRSLAIELAPSVRVNSILPGALETRMTERYLSDTSFTNNYPLGKGAVNDIADSVEFLFSSKSKWITGQQFTIDGGRSVVISD